MTTIQEALKKLKQSQAETERMLSKKPKGQQAKRRQTKKMPADAKGITGTVRQLKNRKNYLDNL